MQFDGINLPNNTKIIYSISKENVISKDTTKINAILNILRKDVKNSCDKLAILFDGYDFDSREIYEITEIRQYVTKIFSENEDLFYYLTSLDHNNHVILSCISDFQKVKKEGAIMVRVKNIPNIILKDKIIQGIITCCNGNLQLVQEISKQLFVE